jgi:excisionase family DNA binding protein
VTESQTESRAFDIGDCQFTIAETATHLRVSRSYVYELIGEKKIRPVKLGKRTIIQGVELRRFMKSLADAAAVQS